MKSCPNCKSEVEDNFDVCWNCQYDLTTDKITKESTSQFLQRKKCLRCDVELEHEGLFYLWEGIVVDVKRPFDVYRCSVCNKVEFFMDKSKKNW